MRFVQIPADLSTLPDLSCVVIRKRHRENREIINVIYATINFPVYLAMPYFCD